MKQRLFNPFTRIAGGKALFYGALVMLLTALIACFNQSHFDAVLHLTHIADAPRWTYLIEPLIAWLCTVMFFYLSGLLFSRSRIRFLDVAGTAAFARWPLVFMVILLFIPVPVKPEDIINAGPAVMLPLLLVALLSLPVIILFVILLYNAYSVSCNLKGGKAIWTFIPALVLSDITTRVVFHFFISNNLIH